MNVAKRAAHAVEGISGKIKAAVDRFLGNDHTSRAGKASGLEGEGSYEGTRRYNAGVKRSIAEGRTSELADKPNQARNGRAENPPRAPGAAEKTGPRPAIPRPRRPAS